MITLGLLLIQEAEGQLGQPVNQVPSDAWDRYVTTYTEDLDGPGDYGFSYLVDAIIHRGHEHDPLFTNADSAHRYLDIIEALERIPRLERIDVGKKMLERGILAHEQNRERHFILQEGGGGWVVFMSDPAGRDERIRHLHSLTLAWHSASVERGITSRSAPSAWPPRPIRSAAGRTTSS